jgi:hypothetical protein
VNPSGRLSVRTESLENKTGDLNFRTAGQTFSPPATRTAPQFSHSLAPLLGVFDKLVKVNVVNLTTL